VSHLDKLTEFHIAKNKLISLTGLEKLTGLVLIAAQANFIQDLKGLETLVNLEELYLQQNQVKDFSGLEKNTKLEVLDLAVNKITKLDHLDHLSNTLTDLWANWNQFENTEENREYLRKFKVLETLYLADNPLANVENYYEFVIERVPTLRKLDGNMLRPGMKFYHQQTEGIHPIAKALDPKII